MIYIGLITSNGHAEDFGWYNGVCNFVDGLAVTYHNDEGDDSFKNDGGYKVLNSNIGNGFIGHVPYYGHHAHSMNHFLLNPKIRPGDWILLRDSLEQFNINFLSNIRSFISNLEKQNINSVYQYSKLLMFKKEEGQFFANTPHWGLYGAKPNYLAIESVFNNPKDYAFSTRNDKRGPDHWINHFGSYYLLDSSNHLLLGREKNEQEYKLHEEIRRKFKSYLQSINVDFLKPMAGVNNLIQFWKNNELDYQMKWFVNFEPILNDLYCYHVLGHSLELVNERRGKKEKFCV